MLLISARAASILSVIIDMRYAIIFACLGTTILIWAIRIGGYSYLLFWPAVNCMVLAVGYGGVGPKIFGKDITGKIPFWAWCVHLPFFAYSSVIWHVIRKFSRENAVDQVIEGVYLGRRLLNHETPLGIHNWVDLTAEFQDSRNQRKRHSYINLPILDGMVPDFESLSTVVRGLEPGTTFIHCAQGHGRTGLFALALLAYRRVITNVDEGMAIIHKSRPDVRLNSAQLRFIRAYIDKNKDKLWPAAETSRH